MDALFTKEDLAEYVEQDNILLACQVADNTPVVEWAGYVVSLDERFIVLRTTGKVMVTDKRSGQPVDTGKTFTATMKIPLRFVRVVSRRSAVELVS